MTQAREVGPAGGAFQVRQRIALLVDRARAGGDFFGALRQRGQGRDKVVLALRAPVLQLAEEFQLVVVRVRRR